MKKTKMKRAVIYARNTSSSQNEPSIGIQLKQSREYCQKKGFIVVNEYIDRDFSGDNDGQPSFKRMINDSHDNMFDIVIVLKIDRVSRSLAVLSKYILKLDSNEVSIESVKEIFDDRPTGKMMREILDNFTQLIQDNHSQSTKAGMLRNAKKCYHHGGTPPLGYDVKNKKYVINKEESIIVQKIFDLYSKNHGFARIVGILNSKNYKTKFGNSFKKNSLTSILKNEKYTGVYIYNKTKADKNSIRIKDGMPQIISDELWKVVQKNLKGKHKTVKN